MRRYMLHVPGFQTIQTFTFWLLKGKQTALYIIQHFSDISYRVYHSNFVTCLPFPINCRTRHCIRSSCCLPFLARVCVLRQYWSLSYLTWRMFSCGAFPHIIRSLFLPLSPPIHSQSRFAICHPGQRRVHLLLTWNGKSAFFAFVRSARVFQGPDNDRIQENNCIEMASIQIQWLCLCTAFLARPYKQRKSLLPSSWLSVSLSEYITAVCIGRVLVIFYIGDCVVICRLTPDLVEIGQIYRLLPQRHLSHMLAARIRCLVLCFALSNIAYISILMFLNDVCLLPA